MAHFTIFFTFIIGFAMGMNGVSTHTLINDFSCFKQNGLNYAMVRAYLNFGQVDPNAKQTLIAAEQYKLKYAHAYINPCVQCKFEPEFQITQVVEALKGANYGGIFIMVQTNDRWSSNKNGNCLYINTLIKAVHKYGYMAGVGSDSALWDTIMGKECMVPEEDVACWWIKHDKEQSLDHFKPFAGFTFPSIKEYDGPANVCTQEVDLNFCNC